MLALESRHPKLNLNWGCSTVPLLRAVGFAVGNLDDLSVFLLRKPRTGLTEETAALGVRNQSAYQNSLTTFFGLFHFVKRTLVLDVGTSVLTILRRQHSIDVLVSKVLGSYQPESRLGSTYSMADTLSNQSTKNKGKH